MGVGNRHRHQLFGLIAGVAKHQPLVPRTITVDPHGDVAALRVQRDENAYRLGTEAHVRADIADVMHHIPDQLDVVQLSLGRDFPGENDKIRRAQCLARHAGEWVLGQQSVQHTIRNLV